MKEKDNHKNLHGQKTGTNGENDLPGYPTYPSSEDIFNKYQEEKDINPEDISETKELNEKAGKNRVKDQSEDASGSDLDVPGSELDDEMEDIGSEDEENNYYSIGGDEHSDLDENKG